MPDQTHYSEEDVSAIFQQAIEAQEAARRNLGKREGLTLDELQHIGAELGITPDFIEKAAASRIARAKAKPDRRIVGIPVSVERVVEFARPLTDLEWDRLIVDLRQTFDARGVITQHGSLRQWTNGNLSALSEPSENGRYRLRLGTMKGTAPSSIAMSAGLVVFGIFLTTLLLFKNLPQDPSKYALAAFFALAGLLLSAFTAVSTNRWHRERAAQMDGIAGRVSAMMADGHSEIEAKSEANSVDHDARIDLDDIDAFGTEERANQQDSRTRQ